MTHVPLRVDLLRLRRAVLFRSRERTRTLYWHKPSRFIVGKLGSIDR